MNNIENHVINNVIVKRVGSLGTPVLMITFTCHLMDVWTFYYNINYYAITSTYHVTLKSDKV